MSFRASSTTVRVATPGDLDAVRYVLVEAFLHGDLVGWLIPNLDTRHRIYWQYFGMLAEHALQHGHVEMNDDAHAVAIWHTIADGKQPDIAGHDEHLTTITAPFAPRFAALEQAKRQHHPREPSYQYLAMLGVHPRHQGHGFGSALLRAWVVAGRHGRWLLGVERGMSDGSRPVSETASRTGGAQLALSLCTRDEMSYRL
jgi:ribosomal protein S18 acetylase RimI-like enzyme